MRLFDLRFGLDLGLIIIFDNFFFGRFVFFGGLFLGCYLLSFLSSGFFFDSFFLNGFCFRFGFGNFSFLDDFFGLGLEAFFGSLFLFLFKDFFFKFLGFEFVDDGFFFLFFFELFFLNRFVVQRFDIEFDVVLFEFFFQCLEFVALFFAFF